MGSLKRWRQVGGGAGSFMKWDTPGKSVEGTWLGQHDGKFGPLGEVETMEGKVSFPLHTVLLDRVSKIREGAEIKIEYAGNQASKDGRRTFKAFNVYVASEDDLKPAEPTDDDVPF